MPSKGKAGWRIVTSVVVSSAGEDVLDSLEAGIEYLTDALGDLRVGLSLTELPVVYSSLRSSPQPHMLSTRT